MPFDLSIKGWMIEQELKILEHWASTLKEGATIVEVGSFYGRSAYCLAASAPAGSTVYCFDRWYGDPSDETIVNFSEEVIAANGFPTPGLKNTFEHFMSNVSSLPNIVPKQVSDATEIAWHHGRIVDLFFIDAEHRNPSDWEYINYWVTFLRPGGSICGHDYYTDDRFPDIKTNVERLEKLFSTKVETYAGTSLWRITT